MKSKTMWICSGSEAALRAIRKIHDCSKASLREVGEDKLLNLTWIPGLVGEVIRRRTHWPNNGPIGKAPFNGPV